VTTKAKPAHVDTAARDPVIDKLLELAGTVMASRLGSWGAVSQRLRQEADFCKKRTETVDADAARLRDRAGEEASKLITMWFLSPECVDEAGRPRPLKLWGPSPSLESLGLQNGVAQVDLKERIETLIRLKGVREVKKGRFVPVHQTLMVTDDKAAMLDRGAKILAKLMSTFVHNLNEKNRDAREFERNVHAARLKASEIPEFRRFLASQGQMFIEAVDFWLDERQATKESRSAEVVVEIFSSVEINDPKRPGRVQAQAAHSDARGSRAELRLTGSVK
jgi:hypothetical protein